jgi:hypothetical protein
MVWAVGLGRGVLCRHPANRQAGRPPQIPSRRYSGDHFERKPENEQSRSGPPTGKEEKRRLEPLFLTARQVSQEAQRLANELRDFRDRVLPRLVEPDRPARDTFAWAATVMANNADSLAWSVADRPDPIRFDGPPHEESTWDQVEKAVRATHEAQHPSARTHLLRHRSVTDEELAACRWDGQRVGWSLWAMVWPWPAEVLDKGSRLLGKWLGIEVHVADDLRRLRDLPARRLLRVFRRMPFDTFFQLAESLVRIDPAVPDAVLLVPSGRYGPEE